MATRQELIAAVWQRYREASKSESTKMPDEFAELTKYHRKHAIRVLTSAPCDPRQSLARNRLCGKRLKAFRTAFAANNASVGLVLKTMNSRPDNLQWTR